MKKIQLIGLALASSLMLSLAWPANGFAPLIFIAFVPLLYLQEEMGGRPGLARQKGVFGLVYLSFLVWNTLTTWWIWNSTDIGAIGAIGLNSLFMATVFWLFHQTKISLYDNKKGFFILIAYWLTWEWFHLDWDLSWPWLNLGNVFASRHKWVQWYEITGTGGGTLWILLVNILIYKSIKILRKEGHRSLAFLKSLALSFSVIVIPIVISYGLYTTYEEKGLEAEFVVVQPNFDPYTEQYETPPAEVVERNLSLARRAITPKTDFVISPESAIQEEIWMELLDQSAGLKQVSDFINEYPNLAVVIGASTFSHVPENKVNDHAARKFRRSDGYYFAHNTAFFIDSTAGFDFYHKSKLTPGVEMMPSWRLLKPLKDYAINLGGTVGTLKTNDFRKVFSVGDSSFRLAPIICYESVYGEFVAGFVRNGANLLTIITNDGWWGNSPGHRQHLSFARLRAIETRRSIARSANTGISAFVDQRGDLYQATPYREQAVIRQTLLTNDRFTFYVLYGDFLARIALFVSAIFLITGLVRSILPKKSKK